MERIQTPSPRGEPLFYPAELLSKNELLCGHCDGLICTCRTHQ